MTQAGLLGRTARVLAGFEQSTQETGAATMAAPQPGQQIMEELLTTMKRALLTKDDPPEKQ
eukprot:3737439-Amphidinium_carterae.1